ncbi:hypothetical protein ACP6PF_13930, partial [Klebsiella pneumoniae]
VIGRPNILIGTAFIFHIVFNLIVLEVIIFTTSLLARPIKFTGVFVSFNKSPLNKTRITYQYWISEGLNYNYFLLGVEFKFFPMECQHAERQ